jgi:hypothetical protein
MREENDRKRAYIAGAGGSDRLVGLLAEALSEGDELVAGGLELLDRMGNNHVCSLLCAQL